MLLIACCVCMNRMAALSNNFTFSLMRGNSKTLVQMNANVSFSANYSFEPSLLYNVKKSKCSGSILTYETVLGMCFCFLKLSVAMYCFQIYFFRWRCFDDHLKFVQLFYYVKFLGLLPNDQDFSGRNFR